MSLAREIQDFFDDNNLKLKLPSDAVSLLQNKPVGEGDFKFGEIEVGPINGDISVFDQDLKLGASFKAAAQALAAGDSGSVWRQTPFTPADNQVLSRFELSTEACVEGDGIIPTGLDLLDLSFNAAFKASLFYRHWVLLNPTEQRLDALEKLFQARVPTNVNPRRLRREVHHLRRKIDLDLGLQVGIGFERQFGFERNILGDMFSNLALKADVQATLRASLGYSLFEDINVCLGDIGVKDQGWVRFVLNRENSRKLSFGAVFNLNVKYDFGSSLITILDEVLELEPVKKARDYLTSFAETAREIGSADWDQIKEKLAEKGAQEVIEFLNEELDLDDLIDGARLQGIIDQVNHVIALYDGVEERLRDLWDRLLTSADLEQGSNIRNHIDRVRNIDTSSLDKAVEDILGADFAEAIELLETLTDLDLETLVTRSIGNGSERYLEIIKRAQELAQKTHDFLENTPTEVLSAWQQWSQKTGIFKVVNWLKDNARSVDKIKAAIDEELTKVVEKLLGKVIDNINRRDVQRLQEFAKKVADALESANEFDNKIKQNLEKLNGELGFNLGIMTDRTTRQTQILDIEFDTGNSKVIRAWNKMRSLDMKGFLAALPVRDEDDEEPLPYRFREAMFTNTKVKANAIEIFLSRLIRSGVRRCMTSEIVKIQQSDNEITRIGDYEGSLIMESSIKENMNWLGGMALTCETRGGGTDLDADYDSSVFSFQFTMNRTDQNTSARELEAIDQLLRQLGFSESARIVETVPEGSVTKFSLNLAMDQDVVKLFFDSTQGWDEAATPIRDSTYLRAGRLWFSTAMVSKKKIWNVPAHRLLTWLTLQNRYTSFWRKRINDYTQAGDYVLTYKGKSIPIYIRASARPTTSLLEKSKKGPKALKRVREKFQSAYSGQELIEMMNAFAEGSRIAVPYSWESPLFMLWLAMVRVRQQGPSFNFRAHTDGLATVRYQKDGKWQPPISFRTIRDAR